MHLVRLVLVIAAVSLILTKPACARHYIVKGGKPCADIVISEEPTRSVKLASRELQYHLRQMTGAELPIASEPAGDYPVHIYVGRSKHTDRLKISVQDLEKDMYKIISGRNRLCLLGHDFDFRPWEPAIMSRADGPKAQEHWRKLTGEKWLSPQWGHFKHYNKELDIWLADGVGSLYAVHDFLRSLGVEWYMPGDLGAIIPKVNTIKLPRIKKTVKPDIGRRRFTFVQFDSRAPGVTDDILWYFRIGLGEDHKLRFGHSLHLIIGHPETKKKHPEYYALLHGKRDTDHRKHGRPCLSSESLFQATVKYLRFFFDTYPEAEMFPVVPTDGYSYLCQCNLCKGKESPGRGYEGKLSDYVSGFANRVAEEIEKSHPGKKISCAAYTTYLLPPEKFEKFSKNVVVVLCRWRMNDARSPENRKHYLGIRDAWLKRIEPGGLYTWDYYLQSQPKRDSAGIPIFFPHAIAEDLKSLKGVLAGEFIEGSRRTDHRIESPGINHLNYYVTARLYWDVDQDVDSMLNQYHKRFFGPARSEMKAFYETAERTWWELKGEDIRRLLDLLAKAQKVAGDTVYGKRIELIRNECEGKLKVLYIQKVQKKEYGRVEVPIQKEGMVKLDGRLDEPFWTSLPENRLVDVVNGETPKVLTTFKLGFSPEALYLGVKCMEPDPESMRISASGPDDTNVWIDDSVELILRTPEHSYYQFAMNPAGAFVDLDRALRGLSGIDWDSGLEVKAYRGGGYWRLEIRIPLESIKGKMPVADNPWHLNVGRVRPRDEGVEAFALVPAGKKTFHNMDKMASIITN